MHYLLASFVITLVVQFTIAPPVTHNKGSDQNEKDDANYLNDAVPKEYQRYLQQVIQVLESDPEFRAKLETANEVDIRTGKIAHELAFVSHKVRTKLDELKREELERLRHLIAQENNINNGLDPDHLKIAEHLDHTNTRTFEINDLKKLIAKISKDLAEADKKRREEFKEYEMQKKFEEQQKMKGMSEEERKNYEQQLKEMKEKHKKHQPLHHPGSKQQLQEVWETQDHMNTQDFDPKTFFYLHDIDGNGLWDQDEVKTLFLKELDKLYAEGSPEDDLVERAEEMERMREHVFNDVDRDKDGFISYEEFLEQTKNPEFQQDPEWEGLNPERVYSPQEYEAFEKHQQDIIQEKIARGKLPPHQGNSLEHHGQYVNVPGGHGVPVQDPAVGGHFSNQVPAHQQQVQGQPIQQHPSLHVQVPQHQEQLSPQRQQQQHQGQLPSQQQQYRGQLPPQQQQQHYRGQVPMSQQQQYKGHVAPQYQEHLPPQQQQQQQQQLNVQAPAQGDHVAQAQLQQQYHSHLSQQTQYQVRTVQDEGSQQRNNQEHAPPHQSSQNQTPQQAQQSQSSQAPIQQHIERNSIPVAGKAK